MIRKTICLLGILLLTASYSADELSDKQKQLEKLQKDLQKAEQKVQQNEAKKKKTETDISDTKKVKQKTDVELRKSQTLALEKLQLLNTVKTELRTVEEQIQDLKSLQNSQLENLVRVKLYHGATKLRHKDQHVLSVMAAQTRTKLNDLGDVQEVLVTEQTQKGRDYSLANSDLMVKATTAKKIDKTVRNLEYEKSRLTKEQKQLENQIAKLRKDAAQLESLIASLTSKPAGEEPHSYKFSAKTISWPVKGRIIRSYGQETRSYGTSVVCNGIDISVPEWTTVSAADAGEVVFAGSYGGQGKLLIIDHKNGFFTVYAYNNELLVSTGSNVRKGQAVAKSGMTGSATVPSLHFEVRKDGKAVNPLSYLD
jgi:murein DD-endopeptidase MepM/ murein hydrolase activator NlpD